MTKDIKKVAVIGAGAMGSGIAAQIANAGVQVYLLDKNPKAPQAAIDRMLKAKPTDPMNAGFMTARNAKFIKTGNTDEHLEEAVKDADWIVEVIVEDLGLKRGLFSQIEKFRKPGSIVSSNTSTLPLRDMAEGRSEDFKKHFLITHFFNPVRFMRLLEIVSGEKTDAEATKTMDAFCDKALGKHVIHCKDTPGFAANRIGAYFLFRAIIEAIDKKIPIEEADAVLGKPLGLPKDGVFGLLDLVGINIVPHVSASLRGNLPESDDFNKIYRSPRLIDTMLAHAHWGRNAPLGGFYRMKQDADGNKTKQVLDMKAASDMFDSGAWDKIFGVDNRIKNDAALDALYKDAVSFKKIPAPTLTQKFMNAVLNRKALPAPAGIKPELACVEAGKKGPWAVFETGEPASDFAWNVMRDTLLYAASLVPEVSDDITLIDAAMKEGYNWKYGPFELIDKIGVDWFVTKALNDGKTLPPALKMAGDEPFYIRNKDGDAVKRRTFDFATGKAGYAAIADKEGILTLKAVKEKSKGKPILTGQSASLWDIGDGVVCFEFHSKLNTLDPSIMKVMNDSIKLVSGSNGKYKAMVIYNDEENFSVGANLGFAKIIGSVSPKLVEDFIYAGQRVYQALRYAPFPVVGAPRGLALGGACEMLLHCDAVQASAETYPALVEVGVGIIPGWGGCVRYLDRAINGVKMKGPFIPAKAAFGAIANPLLGGGASAQDSKAKLWFQRDDGISMNKDRVLTDAKAKALSLVPGYTPPKPSVFNLGGEVVKTAFDMGVDDFYKKGDATWHDVVVFDALGEVISGGKTHYGLNITEEQLLQKEREAFMSLVVTPQTKKRIDYTLAKGKPLREEALPEPKTTAELRATRTTKKLEDRPYDGTPLSGKDEKKLAKMAAATWLMYKIYRP